MWRLNWACFGAQKCFGISWVCALCELRASLLSLIRREAEAQSTRQRCCCCCSDLANSSSAHCNSISRPIVELDDGDNIYTQQARSEKRTLNTRSSHVTRKAASSDIQPEVVTITQLRSGNDLVVEGGQKNNQSWANLNVVDHQFSTYCLLIVQHTNNQVVFICRLDYIKIRSALKLTLSLQELVVVGKV